MKATAAEYLNHQVVNVQGSDHRQLVCSPAIQGQLATAARQGYPFEIVGFLLGKREATQEIVTALYPVDNKAREQRRRFEIDALDYLKVERYALEQEVDVIGVYHSHPDYPAIPSIHDLKAAQAVFAYVIISIDEGGDHDLLSWKKETNRFIQQPIAQTEEEIPVFNS